MLALVVRLRSVQHWIAIDRPIMNILQHHLHSSERDVVVRDKVLGDDLDRLLDVHLVRRDVDLGLLGRLVRCGDAGEVCTEMSGDDARESARRVPLISPARARL